MSIYATNWNADQRAVASDVWYQAYAMSGSVAFANKALGTVSGTGIGSVSSPLTWSGDNGQSFGPFQLCKGGGLANQFAKDYGFLPDASNWQDQIDFSLNHMLTNGFGDWHFVNNYGGLANVEALGAQNAATLGFTPNGLSSSWGNSGDLTTTSGAFPEWRAPAGGVAMPSDYGGTPSIADSDTIPIRISGLDSGNYQGQDYAYAQPGGPQSASGYQGPSDQNSITAMLPEQEAALSPPTSSEPEVSLSNYQNPPQNYALLYDTAGNGAMAPSEGVQMPAAAPASVGSQDISLSNYQNPAQNYGMPADTTGSTGLSFVSSNNLSGAAPSAANSNLGPGQQQSLSQISAAQPDQSPQLSKIGQCGAGGGFPIQINATQLGEDQAKAGQDLGKETQLAGKDVPTGPQGVQ
ncbi:MAG: hypothetical protein J2P49_03250 [Methylocapsa sp.]|nr:hypothetical protein [Methylocapsa sp.]